MIRIPVESFNIPIDQDLDVLKAWNWFMTLFSAKEWQERKDAIEKRIKVEPRATDPFSESIDTGTLLSIKDDQIGWYLYLVEMFLKKPYKYEYFQGARVVPVFKRIGMDFDLLMSIDGVKRKAKNLVKVRKKEADAILFEILTALSWTRNGWKVEFLEEGKGGKSPDLFVKKGKREYFVECKRQMKTGDYTYRETKKRQVMVSKINKELIMGNFLLDVVFHVELHTLSDDYLKDLLLEKLSKITTPCKIVDEGVVNIEVSFVDIARINAHLDKFYVKHHSPQLNLLIGGKAADNLAFTSGLFANFFLLGEGEVNNQYVHQVENAYGVFWQCDSSEAINMKARDIKRQFYSALEQFPEDKNVIIHVGMETFDGPAVESERFLKINDTLENMGSSAKSLKWAYLHFFQSYSTPEEAWVFDETVNTISQFPTDGDSPLPANFLVVPEEVALKNIAHWERELP